MLVLYVLIPSSKHDVTRYDSPGDEEETDGDNEHQQQQQPADTAGAPCTEMESFSNGGSGTADKLAQPLLRYGTNNNGANYLSPATSYRRLAAIAIGTGGGTSGGGGGGGGSLSPQDACLMRASVSSSTCTDTDACTVVTDPILDSSPRIKPALSRNSSSSSNRSINRDKRRNSIGLGQ
jgi:hypothetical protein